MQVTLKHQQQVIAEAVRLIASDNASSWSEFHEGTYMLTRNQLQPSAPALKPGAYEVELPDGASAEIELTSVREHDGYYSGTFATSNRASQVILQRPLQSSTAIKAGLGGMQTVGRA